MTFTDVHEYKSAATDIEGRNDEIKKLKADLLEQHGEGEFTARRIGPDGQFNEFGDRVRWQYRT